MHQQLSRPITLQSDGVATVVSTDARLRGLAGKAAPAHRSLLADVLDMIGTTTTYERDEEICGEGERAEQVYLVRSGCVRNYKLLKDGRRQIVSFALPGEVFGLEAGNQRTLSAEAVQKATVVAAKRTAVLDLTMGDRVLSTELWKVAAEALSRMQERLLLLGRKSAHERVAAFLLEMAERTGGTDTIALPMSRLDIADYLGLTIETVSRTISQLEHTGVIDLPRSRQIELRDRRALRLLDG